MTEHNSPNTLIVHCDGATEPSNPGGHGVGGFVIRDARRHLIYKGAVDLGQSPNMTNNIAEYGAVKGALEYLISKSLTKNVVYVRTDSKLIVEQLNDHYKCNVPHLRTLRDAIWHLVTYFDKEVAFQWVRRIDNTEADEMSRSLYTTDEFKK